jgi:Rps23 Pro-64 3,4-dihydroxylase Tpa1-like proline 4-hydroxylase
MMQVKPHSGGIRMLKRTDLADLMVTRLAPEVSRMKAEFATAGRIGSTTVDDLLPAETARAIFEAFPRAERMVLKRSIKEHKHVAAQMDAYDPILEEAVYAFQDSRVVDLVSQITGLRAMEPDADLYAGGISLMTKGGYLRPHLDNSHDGSQGRYRVLNLLYYVTPEWQADWGGSLQLWDRGPQTEPRTIPSLFNRLILMVTNRTSWHSVNTITHEGSRCCVSNYYFSKLPPEEHEYFHATSFRGERAGVTDLVMRADNALRTTVLKVLPGAYKNPHVFKR